MDSSQLGDLPRFPLVNRRRLHWGFLALALTAVLSLAPAQHAHAQSYAWMNYDGCFWPTYEGPYISPTDAYNTCISQFYKDGGSPNISWEMVGAFTGQSDSDPACPAPTAAGQHCYVDIWDNSPTMMPPGPRHYGWYVLNPSKRI